MVLKLSQAFTTPAQSRSPASFDLICYVSFLEERTFPSQGQILDLDAFVCGSTQNGATHARRIQCYADCMAVLCKCCLLACAAMNAATLS